VNENILSATINCNETETLFRVEPLNCACCHVFIFLRYVGVQEILKHGLPLAPAIPIMQNMKRVLIKRPTEIKGTAYAGVNLTAD
jgi:hypothetical protein